jgi:hypothetical protein
LGEIFPNHLRAKGVVVGVGTITAINIVWLQTAPIAFNTIGYKFYMVFFIPGFIATAWLWVYFPNTLGLPLEEVAKIFGDADELSEGPSRGIVEYKSEGCFNEHQSVSHVENNGLAGAREEKTTAA